jgi:LL-diaminopimelate aminotransferase
MFHINHNFTKLQGSYLFSEIAKRVAEYQGKNPGREIIRLGIGDVTCPLAPAVVEAMNKAIFEMSKRESFRGYGPEQGYDFLRNKIVENDYLAKGVQIAPDEVFVSDGSKCDTGNIEEILGGDCIVAVTDPVYPVYVDTNVMAGRAGDFDAEARRFSNLVYIETTAANGFEPSFPQKHVDVVYLCSPNNPTGMALNRSQLKKWVDWANKNNSLILFDGAYERFITEKDIPHSIFEIEGAKTCAIEFRSFSKTAGFTGTRCAYTVIPKELVGADANGNPVSLNALWLRRHTTKFNGVSYFVQRAAEAVYSPEGNRQVNEVIAYYLNNAKIILEGLQKVGIEAYGGVNSPYVWLKTPGNLKSWDFFDLLLSQANVVGTPGSGFGCAGEGYFRLTAFNTEENTVKAIERFSGLKL